MHLYELPWPQEELRRLGEIPVTLRITYRILLTQHLAK